MKLEIYYRDPKSLPLDLVSARWIQYMSFHPISSKSILISSSHLCLSFPSGIFPPCFPTRNFCVFIFLFKRFIAQKIQRDTQGYKIFPLTNLPQLSFAEASDRVSTVLGMYKCSSEKQVQREKHGGRFCVFLCSQVWHCPINVILPTLT